MEKIPEQRDWSFVDPPLKEFFCPMCKQILKEPMLTECCGSHFCKACMKLIKQAKQPCPNCNQPNFNSMMDRNTWRKILELDVLCPKNRACHWKGEVRAIENHLDPKNENSCEYLDITCTYGCGEDMVKHELAEHLNQFCPRRPYRCDHCGLDGVYNTIVNKHIPVCPKYPHCCQNDCGRENIPRSDYDQHLAECPEQEVQCQFHHVGCEKRIRRKNIAHHQKEESYTHLSLQTAFTTRQLLERDQKLEDLSLSWEHKYQELAREMENRCERESNERKKVTDTLRLKIAQKDEVITQFRSQISEKDKVIDDLRQGLKNLKANLEKSQQEAKDCLSRKLKDLATKFEEKQQDLQKEQLAQIKSLENAQQARLEASVSDHAGQIEELRANVLKLTACVQDSLKDSASVQVQPGGSDQLHSEQIVKATAHAFSPQSQSVYENMNSDALALLEKLPIGSIDGVHYDVRAGRVLIDKETPQLEEEQISKFQSAYQSITGKKLKIVEVPVPPGASPDAMATLLHHYNITYDQCVFMSLEGSVKIISVSSRQIDQAKTLLTEDILKTSSSTKHAALKDKSELIQLSANRTLTLKKADIVKEKVEIIVNPANSRLAHGGGIAAVLNRASKGQLQKYSNCHIQMKGTVPVGTVVISGGGGALKCSKVIHAVGPDNSTYSEADCERLLNKVVCETLKGAERYNANSIAFPAISTGIFGVKKELVARCVVDTIMAFNFTKPSPVLSDIRIVIIDEKTYAPFAQYFHQKQKALKATASGHKPLIQPSKFNPSTKKSPSSPPPLESGQDETASKNKSPSPVTAHSASKTPDTKLSPKDSGKIRSLLSSLAENWMVLGTALGFDQNTLEKISSTSADSNAQLNRVLYKWLCGDAHSPTVSVLVNAVISTGGTKSHTVVQKLIAAFEGSTDQESTHQSPSLQNPTEAEGKSDIDKISYPGNFTDESHDKTGQAVTSGDTTATTMTAEQLIDPLAQMNMSSSAQSSTAGQGNWDPQTTAAHQSNYSSAQSTFSTSTSWPGTVTATAGPTPSTTTMFSSPPTTVSTSPPGFPAHSPSPGGYNSGHPWKYPGGKEQGENLQFPFNATGGQSSNAAYQHTYPQLDGSHHVNANMDAAQGGLLQSDSMHGGSATGSHGIMQHPQTNYQPAAGAYCTSTNQPQQCQWGISHSNAMGGVWSSHGGSHDGSSPSFSQAVAGASQASNTTWSSHGGSGGANSPSVAGAGQKSGSITVTTQPRPQNQSDHQTENCAICLNHFTDPVTTKCGHVFCKECLDKALLHAPYCPHCKTPLRRIVGNQPVGGTMTFKCYNSQLPGYSDCGTIEIHYYIPGGIQTDKHPHPGRKYRGTSRTAYLPNNQEGRQVSKLLKNAFDARLIFTVGTSVSSGQSDVVTWNDIHHKTSPTGGPQSYGYPDADYLQRVKADLAAKGIGTLAHESTI